ncbi:ferredoxin III, nif-specific [Defluviicoccus vanus]|uniref:Ferredoxin III n=1 Tax=Defluviicoccus vanus TaxID=111831 RepID=A0A7H1N5G8_9PROT|nr:ferredoxin III, nif-specific [Defluviicoccus vanus]QNT70954.1 ferredoxin III, nif-specific [Defluviicoccus vanus]
MSDGPFLTRDGTPWTPLYLDSIDPEICIGCGRCFKVCGQNVMALKAINEDGEIVDPEEEESERMITVVENSGNCVGCRACMRVCTTKAQHFVAA